MVDSDLLFGKEITIYSEANQFILHKKIEKNSTIENDSEIFVSVNKETKNVKSIKEYTKKSHMGYKVYTILGALNGRTNYYILGVNKATFIGNILSSRIFKIEELVYVSSLSSQTSNVIPEDDMIYIQMLNNFIERNNLYFSDSLDLTLKMQSTFQIISMNSRVPKVKGASIFQNTELYFCWNYHMAREFDSSEFEGFISPVINGFIGIRTVSDYSYEFNYILISRKDNRRSGMRFLIRGIDKNGCTANFVETEEIVIERNRDENSKINLMSFLQIRGSIPLHWTQFPNLQLNPHIQTNENYSENLISYRKHISQIVSNYGKVVLVNLIDKKNEQKHLGDYFLNLSKDLKEDKTNPIREIDYVWFDFHQECKNMKYQNLSKLTKIIFVSQAFNQQDFFHVLIDNSAIQNNYLFKNKSNIKIFSLQKGVFRTNCIDCLDRTNVVQTLFARQMLHKMLFKLNICEGPTGDSFQEFSSVFENNFKVLWADHGDYLSLAYSGTKALKSDFVRTGKRTNKGALQDGINTCKRFCINNFYDGYNQDCHDYFLGKLNPKKQNFKEHKTITVKILVPASLLLVFILYNFLMSIAFPKEYEDNLRKKLLRLLIFIGIFVITFKSVFTNLKKNVISTPTIDHT